MATASSWVMLGRVPKPSRTPVVATLPGRMRMRLDPSARICSATRAWAPAPTETMAMTAPTPMMMPSIVSMLRIMLTRSERTAMRLNLESRLAQRVLWPLAHGPYHNEVDLYDLARSVEFHDRPGSGKNTANRSPCMTGTSLIALSPPSDRSRSVSVGSGPTW